MSVFNNFFVSLFAVASHVFLSFVASSARVCLCVVCSPLHIVRISFSLPNFQHECTSQFQSRRFFVRSSPVRHRLPFSRCHRLHQLTFFRRFVVSSSRAVLPLPRWCNIIIRYEKTTYQTLRFIFRIFIFFSNFCRAKTLHIVNIAVFTLRYNFVVHSSVLARCATIQRSVQTVSRRVQLFENKITN